MGLEKGKFFDVRLTRELCDGMNESVLKYDGYADDTHQSYDEFDKNELFHGTAATALKLFVVGGTGRMLTELTDIHKQMVEDQNYLIGMFESMVDASPVARIEYDTLEEINTDFKDYYTEFTGIAADVERIVGSLNAEFGTYDHFPNPDNKGAINGFVIMCGGDGSGGFLKGCQDKLISFDHEMTSYLKGRDTVDHLGNIQNRINRTIGSLGSSVVSQDRIAKSDVTTLIDPKVMALSSRFTSFCDKMKDMFDVRTKMGDFTVLVHDKLESIQDSVLTGSFSAFESIDNSFVQKITTSGFYKTYKSIVQENIIDSDYYSDPMRHGMTAGAQILSKVGETIGDGLKKGIDYVIEHTPDSPLMYLASNGGLFQAFTLGGALQSYYTDGNLDNTAKYTNENIKSFEKGGLYCVADMVSGIFSLPELLVTMQYAPQDLRNGAVDYLKTNGVKNIPNDLKVFAETKQEEMKALWDYAETELKGKYLDDNGNIDIGQCYESAGYLTVFIASFFVGAGEAKSASTAGEAGGKASNIVSKTTKLSETPLDELANISKTPAGDVLRLAETPADEVGRALANSSDDALRASEKVETRLNAGKTYKSQYDIPISENGYTKSSLELGKKVHKEYMSDVEDGINRLKEYILPSGKRVDYIDFENMVVYELKPHNPNQIKKGIKQLSGYLEEIETVFGKGWSSVLDTY